MRRNVLISVVTICLLIPALSRAQVVDSTVCDILASPQSFEGKVVRVRGTVVAGFEEFAIKGPDCHQPVNAIWLSYPAGTHAKAGPVALLHLELAKNNPAPASVAHRAPVSLERNGDFKKFDKFLSTPAKAGGICLACAKFTVTATLVGRLDAAKQTGFIRDGQGKVIGLGGFGNQNRYSARLVLQSVSDVTPREIDYKKGAVSTQAGTAGGFVPGSPSPDQVQRGADAFGAPGEDNGVGVSFGVANEAPRVDSNKSDASSPDGLLFTATFDSDRLKGPQMQMALSHIGTHIADLRSNSAALRSLSLYGSEFRAWQTSILSAIGAKAKSLTLPGGYVIYSKSWPMSELGKKADSGIAGFLTGWAGISNPPKP